MNKTEFKSEYVSRNGEEVCNFVNGFAKVKLNRKWSFIDTNGNEITDFKYDGVCNFVNGFARVMLNNKWGFIDTNGNEITPIIYNQVDNFDNGYAFVKLQGKIDMY